MEGPTKILMFDSSPAGFAKNVSLWMILFLPIYISKGKNGPQCPDEQGEM